MTASGRGWRWPIDQHLWFFAQFTVLYLFSVCIADPCSTASPSLLCCPSPPQPKKSCPPLLRTRNPIALSLVDARVTVGTAPLSVLLGASSIRYHRRRPTIPQAGRGATWMRMGDPQYLCVRFAASVPCDGLGGCGSCEAMEAAAAVDKHGL